MAATLLLGATLACVIPGLGGGVATVEPAESGEAAEIGGKEKVEEEVVEEPTATPVPPTDVPPATNTPLPTNTPAPSATPRPRYINVDNARDVAMLDLLGGGPGATVLLAVGFSPIEDQVASFGYGKVVTIWDVDSGNMLYEMAGHSDFGFGMEYSPDGTTLASGGCGDFSVRLWDPRNGSSVRRIPVSMCVYRVVWSPDGEMLAAVGEPSSRAQIFDPKTGEEIMTLSHSRETLWGADFSPDGQYFATVDNNGVAVVYDLDTQEMVTEIRPATLSTGWDIEFSPDSELLATAHANGDINVFRTDSWARVTRIAAHGPRSVMDVAFGRDSDVIFSAGADGVFAIWDANTGAELMSAVPVASFDLLPRTLWYVSLSGEGNMVAVAVDDGSLAIIGLP